MGATKKIKFTVSPTGKFGLAYNVGETGSFETKQAEELIEAGYAVPAGKSDSEKAAEKATAAEKAAAEKLALDKAAEADAAEKAEKAAADNAAVKATADKK